MDRSRRDRFAPTNANLTWEPLAAAFLATLTLLAIAPLVVQGVAAYATTGEFAWPHGHLLAAYNGLRRGHFGAGLTGVDSGRLPPDAVLWTLTGLVDALLLGAAVVAGPRVLDLAGHSSRHGLATATQAAEALGRRRLRKSAAVVRPDLYRRPRGRRPEPRTLERTATASTNANPRTSKRPWYTATRVETHQVGWRLGRAGRPGPSLWVPFDRTTCVIGPQGSGKTLDLLAPALLDAPGAALLTLTKPEDLFLTLEARRLRDGSEHPIAVLDPFDLAPGTPELVWDPIAGCEDAMLAERRAKAFSAGTITGATAQTSDQAARFYAGECAKVLQAYFHAAAIAGLDLEDVLTWVSSPRQYPQPEEILRTHPAAEPLWDGLLRGALFGDDRTAGNTITTVQQAMALYFQSSIRARCVPTPDRPATDLETLIAAGGTIYLLGRDDPYTSASPLMTAVTEHVLDTAKRLGETSPHGRLCPPFLACLDELPSTAPIPTLATRMANERALGVTFVLAAQTWRQLVVTYGEDQARTIYGLSNNLVVFGGGKDIGFYQELSDLIGSTTHTEVRRSTRGDRWFGPIDRSRDQRRVPILEPAELRRIDDRQALVLSEAHDPILANLHRCIDGHRGKGLLAAQARARRAIRRANSFSDASSRQPTGAAVAGTTPPRSALTPPLLRAREEVGPSDIGGP